MKIVCFFFFLNRVAFIYITLNLGIFNPTFCSDPSQGDCAALFTDTIPKPINLILWNLKIPPPPKKRTHHFQDLYTSKYCLFLKISWNEYQFSITFFYFKRYPFRNGILIESVKYVWIKFPIEKNGHKRTAGTGIGLHREHRYLEIRPGIGQIPIPDNRYSPNYFVKVVKIFFFRKYTHSNIETKRLKSWVSYHSGLMFVRVWSPTEARRLINQQHQAGEPVTLASTPSHVLGPIRSWIILASPLHPVLHFSTPPGGREAESFILSRGRKKKKKTGFSCPAWLPDTSDGCGREGLGMALWAGQPPFGLPGVFSSVRREVW